MTTTHEKLNRAAAIAHLLQRCNAVDTWQWVEEPNDTWIEFESCRHVRMIKVTDFLKQFKDFGEGIIYED